MLFFLIEVTMAMFFSSAFAAVVIVVGLCGQSLLVWAVTKPGTCPSVKGPRNPHLDDKCTNDAQCKGDLKCCLLSAGFKICRPPAKSCTQLECGAAPCITDGYGFPQCAASCLDILSAYPNSASGVYTINLGGEVDVYCDMVTDGGGWTVLVNRVDGSVLFNRTYADYEHGFGLIGAQTNFFLGLQLMHLLMADSVDLRFDAVSPTGDLGTALYGGVSLNGASDKYRIFTGSFLNGNMDDALNYNSSLTINGMQFTTYDSDNDQNAGANCANVWFNSGWWWNDCAYAAVTFPYFTFIPPNITLSVPLTAGWDTWEPIFFLRVSMAIRA